MAENNNGGAFATLVNTMTWPIKRLQDIATPVEERIDVDSAVSDAVAPLRKRLDSIVNDLSTRVSSTVVPAVERSVREEISPLSVRIGSFETDVRGLREDVDQLRDEISQLREEIGQLRTQAAADAAKKKTARTAAAS